MIRRRCWLQARSAALAAQSAIAANNRYSSLPVERQQPVLQLASAALARLEQALSDCEARYRTFLDQLRGLIKTAAEALALDQLAHAQGLVAEFDQLIAQSAATPEIAGLKTDMRLVQARLTTQQDLHGYLDMFAESMQHRDKQISYSELLNLVAGEPPFQVDSKIWSGRLRDLQGQAVQEQHQLNDQVELARAEWEDEPTRPAAERRLQTVLKRCPLHPRAQQLTAQWAERREQSTAAAGITAEFERYLHRVDRALTTDLDGAHDALRACLKLYQQHGLERVQKQQLLAKLELYKEAWQRVIPAVDDDHAYHQHLARASDLFVLDDEVKSLRGKLHAHVLTQAKQTLTSALEMFAAISMQHLVLPPQPPLHDLQARLQAAGIHRNPEVAPIFERLGAIARLCWAVQMWLTVMRDAATTGASPSYGAAIAELQSALKPFESTPELSSLQTLVKRVDDMKSKLSPALNGARRS